MLSLFKERQKHWYMFLLKGQEKITLTVKSIILYGSCQ